MNIESKYLDNFPHNFNQYEILGKDTSLNIDTDKPEKVIQRKNKYKEKRRIAYEIKSNELRNQRKRTPPIEHQPKPFNHEIHHPIIESSPSSTDNVQNLMIIGEREKFLDLSFEEINLNFKTLSRIKEYDKLYLRDLKTLEIDDSIIPSVSRTIKSTFWNGYNRSDVIDFLLHLTEQTMKILDTLISQQSKQLGGIVLEMEQALIGLNKLKITYFSDNSILTRLDMIIDKFDKKIRITKSLTF